MLAEVCQCYGWTVEHILEMPATRFFKMLEQSRKLKAVERIEQCWIAGIPGIGNVEFFEKTVGRYEKVLMGDDEMESLEVSEPESQAVVFDLFSG